MQNARVEMVMKGRRSMRRTNSGALHEPPFRPRPRSRPRSNGLVSRTRTSRRTIRFMVPMHGRKAEGASMNRPGHRIADCHGKAALKTHALRTLTRGPWPRQRAKRLECVRFIGAFTLARDGQWFMAPKHGYKAEEALHKRIELFSTQPHSTIQPK